MKLTTRQKSSIRHFVFYLVNGTLDFDLLNNQLSKGNYHELLQNSPEIFYKTCCVFINQEYKLSPKWPSEKLGRFIYDLIESNNTEIKSNFEPWELNFEISGDNLPNAFKKFAKWFTEFSVIEGVGFAYYMKDGATFNEQCFAIWSNVIEFEYGEAINSEYTKTRVIEYMKSYYIGYNDKLEDWECELH